MAILKYMFVGLLLLGSSLPEGSYAASKNVQDIVEKAKAKHSRVEAKDGFFTKVWKDVLGGKKDVETKKTVTVEENIEIQKEEIEKYAVEPRPEDHSEEVEEGVWHIEDEVTPEPTRFILYQDVKRGLVPLPISAGGGAVCEDASVGSLLQKISLLEREKEALRELVGRLSQGDSIGE